MRFLQQNRKEEQFDCIKSQAKLLFKTLTFYFVIEIMKKRSRISYFQDGGMLQILPQVFPCISCLESANAVQCLRRPGQKNWRQKSSNPTPSPRMSPGSTLPPPLPSMTTDKCINGLVYVMLRIFF